MTSRSRLALAIALTVAAALYLALMIGVLDHQAAPIAEVIHR